MSAKFMAALFGCWLGAQVSLTSLPIPLAPLDLKTDSGVLLHYAIPGTSLNPAQLRLLAEVHRLLVLIEGKDCEPLALSIRHGGTSIDLVSPPSTKRDYNLIWTTAFLQAERKLIRDIEVDEETLEVFYHITPLSSTGTD